MFVSELRADLHGDEHSEIIILNQCGHVCNIEKADEFNRLSLEFLQKHSMKKAKIG